MGLDLSFCLPLDGDFEGCRERAGDLDPFLDLGLEELLALPFFGFGSCLLLPGWPCVFLYGVEVEEPEETGVATGVVG